TRHGRSALAPAGRGSSNRRTESLPAAATPIPCRQERRRGQMRGGRAKSGIVLGAAFIPAASEAASEAIRSSIVCFRAPVRQSLSEIVGDRSPETAALIPVLRDGRLTTRPP